MTDEIIETIGLAIPAIFMIVGIVYILSKHIDED